MQSTFSFQPLARSADPVESHEAAMSVADSLSRREHYAMSWVRQMPGCTAAEMDAAACHRSNTIGKRLKGLERKRIVRRGDSRRCRITGNKAATWSEVITTGK